MLLGAASLPHLALADDDADVRWTNTVRLGTQYQFNKVPPLAENKCWSGINCGYGSDFTQGRADWLSELEVGKGDIGLKASLEARKDMVERDSSYIQLFEANLHGAGELAGRPVTFSIGRQSVIWGESLYFAGNGIAGAQAPIDATAGFDSAGYAATAHFLPVGQASASWQVTDTLTLLAYQQFEWRRDRVDPEDAYASSGDVLGDDDLRRIALYDAEYGPISYNRIGAATPGGADQFGLGLKLRRNEWDIGLYLLQFDAKTPAVVYYRQVHDYSLNYARGAGLAGASLAGPIGDATLGAEFSVRRHTQLSDGGIFIPAGSNGDPAIPRGDTLNGQVSLTVPIEPGPILPGGATWTTEIAGNHLSAVPANPGLVAPDRTRDAGGLRTLFTAQFYQVLPRLDLGVPIGVGYAFAGRSAVIPEMNRGAGDVSIGLAATFASSWTADLTLTRYFGTDWIPIPGYSGRPLSEWNKIGMTVQRSF